jgi:preprotein translocase subunit SecA
MVSRSIESAQKKVEGRNFDIRRHVVQYDDVMNRHREIMYKRRQKLLVKMAGGTEEQADSLHTEVLEMIYGEIHSLVEEHITGSDSELWNMQKLREGLGALHPELMNGLGTLDLRSMSEPKEVEKLAVDLVTSFYDKKCGHFGTELSRKAEQIVVLQSIDSHWMDHIDTMSHLREQVAFSGYAQRDPLVEYQDQGFRLFQKLLATIASTTVRALLQADFSIFAAPPPMIEEESNLQTNEAEIEGQLTKTGGADMLPGQSPSRSSRGPQLTAQSAPKVGRNDPCPCGSGKKFKKCHGKES